MTIEALFFGANVVLLVANLAMLSANLAVLSAKIIIGALDDENERGEEDESQNTP